MKRWARREESIIRDFSCLKILTFREKRVKTGYSPALECLAGNVILLQYSSVRGPPIRGGIDLIAA